MSHIKTGWRAIGEWLADRLYQWMLATLWALSIILFLCLFIIITFTLGGLAGGGIAGAIDGFAEALRIIIEAFVVASPVMVWVLAIWCLIPIAILGITLLIYIGDILLNVITNFFTRGVKTWDRFWIDIYYNGKYAWEGFKKGATTWAAKADAEIKRGWSLITEGAGYIGKWIKSKWPW